MFLQISKRILKSNFISQSDINAALILGIDYFSHVTISWSMTFQENHSRLLQLITPDFFLE